MQRRVLPPHEHMDWTRREVGVDPDGAPVYEYDAESLAHPGKRWYLRETPDECGPGYVWGTHDLGDGLQLTTVHSDVRDAMQACVEEEAYLLIGS